MRAEKEIIAHGPARRVLKWILRSLLVLGLLLVLAVGGGALWLAWSVLRSGRASRHLGRGDAG